MELNFLLAGSLKEGLSAISTATGDLWHDLFDWDAAAFNSATYNN